MPRKIKPIPSPQPGWAVYLRTSSDENQKPEMSRARQKFTIEKNVLEHSAMPHILRRVHRCLDWNNAKREGYQRPVGGCTCGSVFHVIMVDNDRFGRNDTEAMRAIDGAHEFGVAVRFANMPDIDPMHMDQRVLVTMTFTLARRESRAAGVRVKGGLQAKLMSGGLPTLRLMAISICTVKRTLTRKRIWGGLMIGLS